MKSEFISATDVSLALRGVIERKQYDKVFVLADTITTRLCVPLLGIKNAFYIVIEAGESAKNVDTLQSLWKQMLENGASRHSLLVNVGGGVVSDLGGFAAATFMRGIDYVNIPTTLLSMVDASVGGKTAVNFCGLKNQIGVFCHPIATIFSSRFLQTLSQKHLLEGVAEMLKHALLSDEQSWANVVSKELFDDTISELWQQVIFDNVKIKQHIVDSDPYDKQQRKMLNLGHTFAHAFEALSLSKSKDSKQPLTHGFAVAYGLVCALYLSVMKFGFPQDKLRQTSHFIVKNYGRPSFTCDDYDALLSYMSFDKKNIGNQLRLVLLRNLGDALIDCPVENEEIKEAFDFLREG